MHMNRKLIVLIGAAMGASALLAQTPARSLPKPAAGVLANGVALPAFPKAADALDRITPVTEAALASPAPGDWLTWRRSVNDHGFSPLKQIDKNNVANLRVAWSWALPSGPNEATPLVHDGVIFAHGFG